MINGTRVVSNQLGYFQMGGVHIDKRFDVNKVIDTDEIIKK